MRLRSVTVLEAYFSIDGVPCQAIADIDAPNFAVRTRLDRQDLPQIDAPRVLDALHLVVVNVSIDRSVITEDAPVVRGSRDIVNVIVPNLQGSVLRSDIDGAGVHQEVHRRRFSVAVRLVYFIAFYDA